jgi:ferredoxin-NADP reductase
VTAGELGDEDLARLALERVLEDHPRLEECDVYVAGPGAFASAAARGLRDRGLPGEQLACEAQPD